MPIETDEIRTLLGRIEQLERALAQTNNDKTILVNALEPIVEILQEWRRGGPAMNNGQFLHIATNAEKAIQATRRAALRDTE